MNRSEAEKILDKNFKIKTFYDMQWAVIEKLLLNKRVLLIEKTGFGKSLCFQFTSLLKNGITIVFTPLIKKCDFPDFIVSKTINLFNKKYRNDNFDFIVYVPPTESGDLVKNFAIKISKITGIPIFDGLIKIKQTKPQKSFESAYNKTANIQDAFKVTNNYLLSKRILLIDDVCDNGATLKELAKVLTKAGAIYIRPLVIAKTVGGE